MAKILELPEIQTVNDPGMQKDFFGAFRVGAEKLKEYEERRLKEAQHLRQVKLRF